MITERLYYRDAALLDFTATALEGGDPYRVVLDRTAFYPTSGGQPHDTGTLNGIAVVDVIDEDDRVVHVLDAPIGPGVVRGNVNGLRRRDHMQQHTAQHLLSALAEDLFGWTTVSVHFGSTHSTIEYDTGSAGAAQLQQLEDRANAVVAEARPVTISFEDAQAAPGLRKPTDRSGELRVVTIESIDRSACGGTHVSLTSEIGAIYHTGIERLRGRIRVGFVAGQRTVNRLRDRDDVVRQVAAALSCGVDDLATIAANRAEELVMLGREHERSLDALAQARLALMVAASSPGHDGVCRIVHRVEPGEMELARRMGKAAATAPRVVFVATSCSPPTIVVGTSGDSGVDAGAVLKAALVAAGGRGGGSPRMAQGSVPDATLLRAVVDRLVAP